jgi:hypothetical protein
MPSPGPPDIVARRLERLTDNDLRFLVENFPEPAASYEDIARIFASLPTTLESALDAEYVYRKIFENRRELIEISPFLLFNVLLRRCIGGARTQTERAVVNYMANLLSLFVRTERVYRPEAGDRQSYEYFVDLAAEAARADERRRFLLQAHIGNYALYLTGIFRDSLEHRRRYKRRPVDVRYYADMGRVYRDAASTRLARVYKLDDVFLRLALQFDHYRERLNVLAREYLFHYSGLHLTE